ncbi:hypothetical protein [Pyxidicoccus xibeiensis]|uniref:hypothetical protein n=1 Tax=Pyxidicoccus xibeiensis TaxID=2906759 RepID=UPI0020A7B16E|nr:hypothetical protein [Pyxidicoccus xibeiensis]MCP3140941.1 hypothetical protein [Pyxidicoccus xibeiensis]
MLGSRTLALIVALSLAVVPLVSHAGIGSLLGKLGRVGSKGGKAVSVGAKLGKTGKAASLGKAAAGVTGLVAAERAGLAFAGLSDDAARSAAYVARTPDGELVMVTKAAGTSTHSPESLGFVAQRIAPEGTRPSIFLDRSVAQAPDELAHLPPEAELTLVEGNQRLPVRRVDKGQEDVEFFVDTADGAIELSSYVGDGDGEDSGDSTGWLFVGCALVAAGGLVWWRRRGREAVALT